MNRNIERLLDILLQQNDYLTSYQLAEIIGVTERSIRNYVRTLNRNESYEPLVISSNKGYKIQKNIYNLSTKNQFFNNEANLLLDIARVLVDQKDYTSFDEIARKLNYSVENIRIKVQQLFEKIKEMNIKVELDSKIFIGIQIVGTENQKRLLLEQLLRIELITKENLVGSAHQILNGFLSRDLIREQINTIDTVFSAHHVTMDFRVHAKIICHMVIFKYRYDENQIIKYDNEDNKSGDLPEHKIARDILMGGPASIENNSERIALENYLISLPINIPGNYISKINIDKRKVIEHSLSNAEKYYSIPIYSKERYRFQITNHIIRLFTPLEDSIPIYNPYSIETKHEYLFAYSIACFLYDELQRTMTLYIPESEIAYLAIHIQLILAQESKSIINTVLVFQGKSTEAEVFRYKLQTYFPTIQINHISLELDLRMVKKYQLVILCNQMDEELNDSRILTVTRKLIANDILKLQSYIDSVGTFSLIDNLDFYVIDEKNSINAIKYLINKSGYGNLLPYFIKREKMSSTDIGNLVSLPHPFLKGSETSAKIIIGINKSEISWGNQKVRLIIIYVPSADLKANENFFDDIYQHTGNIVTIQKLLTANSKEEFIKLWNQKRRL
ncbi:BglG family transcription antiterminator [Dellaglioa algida]|uniref:BglG family transcription antiterminator n=1 Tax=Dellaglioa algida TaxID=105612 RepID=UPI0024C49192|nr:PTS sugar transporter subunit IIA [Dellaglioa algida]MDK1727897.1 PTS sugar transporter subunit IIA [Dellaglioa algida]MDK1735706.1 PTS sugar transporter subunit IIA [Dellaglioa algida]MDK1737228.1 PTS sugar transporter subunit IIA [Dellaglioa algida]